MELLQQINQNYLSSDEEEEEEVEQIQPRSRGKDQQAVSEAPASDLPAKDESKPKDEEVGGEGDKSRPRNHKRREYKRARRRGLEVKTLSKIKDSEVRLEHLPLQH